jgi:hypothetical protein
MNTGVMTDADILLLRSREISPSNMPPDGAVWLFYLRKDVKAYNEKALAKILDPGTLSIANDVIEGKGKQEGSTCETLLSLARELDYQEAQGLPYELLLKKSAR